MSTVNHGVGNQALTRVEVLAFKYNDDVRNPDGIVAEIQGVDGVIGLWLPPLSWRIGNVVRKFIERIERLCAWFKQKVKTWH